MTSAGTYAMPLEELWGVLAAHQLWLFGEKGGKRATLVRAADHPDRLFAGTQGNASVLPNGDLFVDWGSRGVISEIDPSNRLVFDAKLGTGWNSYRAYRADWIGAPRSRPVPVPRRPAKPWPAAHRRARCR